MTDVYPVPETPAPQHLVFVEDEDGLPLGTSDLNQINTDAVALAFKLAVTAHDPAAFDAAQIEAIDKAGPAGFGYVAAGALATIARDILDPMFEVAYAATGVDHRAAVAAISQGQIPEAMPKVAGRIPMRSETAAWVFGMLFDEAKWPEIQEFAEPNHEPATEDELAILNSLQTTTGLDLDELLAMRFIDYVEHVASTILRTQVCSLIIWAHENRPALLDPMWGGAAHV